MDGNRQRQKRGRWPHGPGASMKRPMDSESDDDTGIYNGRRGYDAGRNRDVAGGRFGHRGKVVQSPKQRWNNSEADNYDAVESDDSYELVRLPKKKYRDISDGTYADRGVLNRGNSSRNRELEADPSLSETSYSEQQDMRGEMKEYAGRRFHSTQRQESVTSRNTRDNGGTRRKRGDDMLGHSQGGYELPERNNEDVSPDMPRIKATPVGINYKSNLETLVKSVQGLRFSDRLVSYLKRTPFWWFAKALMDMEGGEVLQRFKKKDYAISRIMNRFHCDGTRKGFLFGDRFLVPTRNDIQLVFGIRSGRVPVVPGSGTVRVTNFLRRCFPEKIRHMAAAASDRTTTHYRLTIGKVFEKLEELLEDGENADGEDVARLLHLYLLAAFFTPNQSSSIRWRLTELLADFGRICEYDWCSFILTDLLADLSNSSTLKIGACAMFIPFWMCEYTDLMNPVVGSPIFPRFMKWDVAAFGSIIMNSDLDELGRKSAFHKRLIATEVEEHLLFDEIEDSEQEVGDIGTSKSDVLSARHVKKGDGSSEIQSEQLRPSCSLVDKGKAKVEHQVAAVVGKAGEQPATLERPSFELGFDGVSADQPVGGAANVIAGSVVDKDTVWVDSLFTDGPALKLTSPAGAQVTVQFKSPLGNRGVRQLFPGDGAVLAEKDRRIAALEAELEKANSKIQKLTCDLEVKDVVKDAVNDMAIDEYRQSTEEQLYNLGARLTEMEQVKMRLGYQTRADKKKIETLESEKWHLGDKLSREIATHLQVVAKLDELDKTNLENYRRKIALAIENDGLKAEVHRLTVELDNMQPISRLDRVKANVEAAVNTLSEGDKGCARQDIGLPGKTEGVCATAETPAKVVGVMKMHSSDQKVDNALKDMTTSSTCGVQNTLPQTPIAANVDGVHGSNSGLPKVLAGTPNLKYDSGTKLYTPITVKIEPVDEHGSGVFLKSESPETQNTMILRVQERTLLNARKKKDLGTPIALFPSFNKQAGPAQDKVVPEVIRPLCVTRSSVAYKKTYPKVIAWLVDKFKHQLPSDTVLTVELSYMNNFVTLHNMESLLNYRKVDEAVIDTWGLLMIQLNNTEHKTMEDRMLVSRQTYLFKSFLWLQVARYDMDYSYKGLVAQFLDKKIRDALEYETWLFPINTTGGLNPRTHVGNHWTLLKFTLSTCSWVFYNPLAPQRADMDEHYKAALTLINYVEKQIKIAAIGRRLPVLRSDHKLRLEWCTVMPQQDPGSLDCGVVVCFLMESIIRKWELQRAFWTNDEGGKNRAYMVNVFVETVIKTEKDSEESGKDANAVVKPVMLRGAI